MGTSTYFAHFQNKDIPITHLSKEPLTAAARRCRIVDVDVVVLGRHRFLYKRLVEHDPIDLDVVLGLDQFVFWKETN